MGRPLDSGLPLAERFWPKVQRRGPRDCWEWTGAVVQCGYGQILHSRRRRVYAHRASWEITHGPVPDGLWVLHVCDNRTCVNPDHLFLGTYKTNIWDKTRKGRSARKLTESQVRAIRAAQEPLSVLAQRHGVSVTMIQYVRNRQSWAWVA